MANFTAQKYYNNLLLSILKAKKSLPTGTRSLVGRTVCRISVTALVTTIFHSANFVCILVVNFSDKISL